MNGTSGVASRRTMLKPRDVSSTRLMYSAMATFCWIVISLNICGFTIDAAYGGNWGWARPETGAQVLGSALLIPLLFVGMILLFINWTKPSRFDCPYCGNSLDAMQKWHCGKCGAVNNPAFFWEGCILSSCPECNNRPHTLQCPHCHDIIELVVDVDDRHPALMLDVPPISPPKPVSPETLGEAEARTTQEQQDHEQRLHDLQRQTQIIEAQVRRAMAEAKLARFSPKDETETTINELMKEIRGAFDRHEALMKFRKLKVEEIDTRELSANEKADLLDELDTIVSEAKARFL